MKRKTDNFNKFYNKKRNSAIKEEFRQEKKAAKKERKEAIERHFEERRKTRGGGETFNVKGKAPQKPTFGKAAVIPATPVDTNKPFKGGAPGKAQQANSSVDDDGDLIPLNKYISHGGICSRRDAAELIRLGKVTVNGQVVTEPGTKVQPSHLVKVNGKKVTISRNFVYILLNKPKDYITTTDDPQGRKTVLDLIRQATTERVYPVGRLDRNTSGVLLLTNDGDLSQKLAHPSHEIKKIYHAVLDKPLTKADFDKIIGDGVILEDGPAHVDVLAYADPKDKTQIGLEIHSGRNRIVRRIFEHLGYDVRGLDRVTYAGLTKKNVQRGKWRLLTEKEIRILKYLNSSIKGSAARAKEWAADSSAFAGDTEKAATAASSKKQAAPGKRPKPAKLEDGDDIENELLSAPAPARAASSARASAPARRAYNPDRKPFIRKGKDAGTDGKPSPRFGKRSPSSDTRGKRPAPGAKRPFSADKRPTGDRSFQPDTRGKRPAPSDTRGKRKDSGENPRFTPSKRPTSSDRRPASPDTRGKRPAPSDRRPEISGKGKRPYSGRPEPSSSNRGPSKRPASAIPPKGIRHTAGTSPRKRIPRKSPGHKEEGE